MKTCIGNHDMRILDLSQEETKKAIRTGEILVSVVGLGRIGLPLAVLIANEGGHVVGCDKLEDHVNKINSGETSFLDYDVSDLFEVGANMVDASCPTCGVRLFKTSSDTFCPYCGRLATVDEYGVHLKGERAPVHQKIMESCKRLESRLRQALEKGFYATTKTTDEVVKSNVTIITVGTPVDENNFPDYTALKDASHAVGKGLQKDSLVVLKSTVAPGTTEGMVKPILESESGLSAGSDFGLSFMPETVYEGQTLHDLQTLPRIVGGVTKRCAQATANIFSIFPAPIHLFESPSTVEAAKLFMNIYRDTNIALVNEFALIGEKLNIDVIKAISAANVERKTHLLMPGLVGGYCLPNDTYHLVRPAEGAGYSPRLITVARELNRDISDHILELVDKVFEEMNIPIVDEKVAVLGLGFKANNGSLRNTQAIPIVEGLKKRGALVVAHDPFVRLDEVVKVLPNLKCVNRYEEVLREARCAVIITDHSTYIGFTTGSMKKFMLQPCAIVDTRQIIDPKEAASEGVIFRGFGKPEFLKRR